MNRRISTVFAAVLAAVLGVCFAVSSFGFVKDNYASEQINALSSLGIIEDRGAGTFVTSGEALEALQLIIGFDGGVEALGYHGDSFDPNANITLDGMLLMTLRACGQTVSSTGDIYGLAERLKIYKVCEGDALIIDLPYGCFAEILWNLLSVKDVAQDKTYAELLIESSFMDMGDYESAVSLVTSYEFGDAHNFDTNGLSTTERSTETSESATESTSSSDSATTSTSYETEDNSGYSPPFRP